MNDLGEEDLEDTRPLLEYQLRFRVRRSTMLALRAESNRTFRSLTTVIREVVESWERAHPPDP